MAAKKAKVLRYRLQKLEMSQRRMGVSSRDLQKMGVTSKDRPRSQEIGSKQEEKVAFDCAQDGV